MRSCAALLLLARDGHARLRRTHRKHAHSAQCAMSRHEATAEFAVPQPRSQRTAAPHGTATPLLPASAAPSASVQAPTHVSGEATAALSDAVLRMLDSAQNGQLSLSEKIVVVESVLREAQAEFDAEQQRTKLEQQLLQAKMLQVEQLKLIALLQQQQLSQLAAQGGGRTGDAAATPASSSSSGGGGDVALRKRSKLDDDPAERVNAAMNAPYTGLPTTIPENGVSRRASSAQNDSSVQLSKIFLRNFLQLQTLEAYRAHFEQGVLSDRAVQQHVSWIVGMVDPEDRDVLLAEFEKMTVSVRGTKIDTSQTPRDAPAPTGNPSPVKPLKDVLVKTDTTLLSPAEAQADDIDGVARWRITIMHPTQRPDAKRKTAADGDGTAAGEGRDAAATTVAGVAAAPSSAAPADGGGDSARGFHAIVTVSKAWERLTGFTQSYFTTLSTAERPFKLLRRDFVPAAHRILMLANSRRLPRLRQFVVLVCANGSEVYVMEDWRVSFNAQSVFQGIVWNYHALPPSQPVPPFIPGVDVDENTILYGYNLTPKEQQLPWFEKIQLPVDTIAAPASIASSSSSAGASTAAPVPAAHVPASGSLSPSLVSTAANVSDGASAASATTSQLQ